MVGTPTDAVLARTGALHERIGTTRARTPVGGPAQARLPRQLGGDDGGILGGATLRNLERMSARLAG